MTRTQRLVLSIAVLSSFAPLRSPQPCSSSGGAVSFVGIRNTHALTGAAAEAVRLRLGPGEQSRTGEREQNDIDHSRQDDEAEDGPRCPESAPPAPRRSRRGRGSHTPAYCTGKARPGGPSTMLADAAASDPAMTRPAVRRPTRWGSPRTPVIASSARSGSTLAKCAARRVALPPVLPMVRRALVREGTGSRRPGERQSSRCTGEPTTPCL